ncbi:hypothetical protein RUM8411_01759 [Ruegeria meonggei]|uniref:Uncharacterized protein n=1 Tax=Ruegeria meonggei TaxID=1446476 RepID=A0A1X6Z3F9_9RHOB|nr:hypothetical protein RUM8411_01759 [Ruegeria meonggei]
MKPKKNILFTGFCWKLLGFSVWALLQTFDIDDCWVSARVISSNNQSKASS